MKRYIAVKLFVPEEHQDTFIALVSELEFTGIEQYNDNLTINFLAIYYNDEIKNELSSIMKNFNHLIREISTQIIDEKNWNEDWESKLEAVIVNEELVITPKNKAEQYSNYNYIIKIDPQMSFGTGYHATTRLASKLLIETVEEGEKWLDAGTGTGVLAILAAKLGAYKIYAFDIEEWAVKNTIENYKINEISTITVEHQDLNNLELDKYDGIVANIFANILIDNMSKFAGSLSPNSYFICTGILKYDKLKVLQSANENGFELVKELSEDEWVAYKFRKAQ